MLSLSLLGERDLLAALESTDISVPARTEGRETHHTERYVVCRLLSTLANQGMIQYPLSIIHRDRPDFALQMGPTQIGLEVTEAIPTKFANDAAVSARKSPGRCLHSPGGGWIGNAAEGCWAKYMVYVVESKLVKLANKEFQKFQRNWLMIYDNLPIPSIVLAEAEQNLQLSLAPLWQSVPAFDTIFIEREQKIVQINSQEIQHYKINDLWDRFAA
jgi:hypothetical protein